MVQNKPILGVFFDKAEPKTREVEVTSYSFYNFRKSFLSGDYWSMKDCEI